MNHEQTKYFGHFCALFAFFFVTLQVVTPDYQNANILRGHAPDP